jgi:hypothetical protein
VHKVVVKVVVLPIVYKQWAGDVRVLLVKIVLLASVALSVYGSVLRMTPLRKSTFSTTSD